ncbi:hypothetical protein D3C75_1197650 [compost metagenome]
MFEGDVMHRFKLRCPTVFWEQVQRLMKTLHRVIPCTDTKPAQMRLRCLCQLEASQFERVGERLQNLPRRFAGKMFL